VRRRRLERCYADLSLATDDTVADISRRWGFRDSSSFSRAFRRQYDVAPRELQATRSRSTTAH
jgi:AraC-like DNA-binding protein